MKKQTRIIRLDEISGITFHLVNIENIFHIRVTKSEVISPEYKHSYGSIGCTCPSCHNVLDINANYSYSHRRSGEQLQNNDLEFNISAAPVHAAGAIFYTVEVKRGNKDHNGGDLIDYYYNINQDSIDRLKEAMQ